MGQASLVVAVVGTIAALVGALGGAAVGSLLSGRYQRLILLDTHRREDRQARVAACSQFLVRYRTFRVFLQKEAPRVVPAAGSGPGRLIPFIEGGQTHEEAIHEAAGHLQFLEGGPSPIVEAATQVHQALRQLALARGRLPDGPLPDDVVEVSREAEREFVRVATRELRWEGRTAGSSS
jgi:hypothetical protein